MCSVQVPALPKYTSQILQRLLKNSSQEYLDYAQAIGSHTPAKVRRSHTWLVQKPEYLHLCQMH